MDGNLYRHTNVMDDRSDLMMVVSLGVNRGRNSYVPKSHRVDLSIDPPCYVSRVNRNYALRDLKMDVNLDAMSHRVMLMDDLSKSCDRMSHDHWRYDHLKMRHRDTNRMDVRNLDVKMMIHHEIHRMKGDRLKVCLKMI
jgi:hypothetical protein